MRPGGSTPDIALFTPNDMRRLTKAHRRSRNLERRFPAVRFLPVVFDGIGAPLIPGIAGDCPVHFDAIITGWRLLADQAGDIVIDIWKTDYPGFPPTIADTITGSDQPTLAGTDKANDTSLTGWTKNIAEGDTLRFNIDSASTLTRVTLTLVLAA